MIDPQKGIELLLPVMESSRTIVDRLNEIGLQRFVSLDRQGNLGKTPHNLVVRETKYTAVLNEVWEEENASRLEDGSTNTVLGLIIRDQFDDSDWALWYHLRHDQDQQSD